MTENLSHESFRRSPLLDRILHIDMEREHIHFPAIGLIPDISEKLSYHSLTPQVRGILAEAQGLQELSSAWWFLTPR